MNRRTTGIGLLLVGGLCTALPTQAESHDSGVALTYPVDGIQIDSDPCADTGSR